MWIVILAADKYVLPPCFISSFELFLIYKVRDFGSLFALCFPDDHSNEHEKEYSQEQYVKSRVDVDLSNSKVAFWQGVHKIGIFGSCMHWEFQMIVPGV